MTKGLRRRIIALQVVLAAVFGAGAGLLFWGSSFIGGTVHDQLAAQHITFPAAGSKALDPKEFPDLQQYAGQQLITGEQAKAYADGFIGRHLKTVAAGKTYSEVSAAAQADPTNTKLASQKSTLFQGETLRGLLLNAWGWSQVGVFARYGAIALSIAAALVVGALLFEIALMWRARRTQAPPARRHVNVAA